MEYTKLDMYVVRSIYFDSTGCYGTDEECLEYYYRFIGNTGE